MKKQAFNKENPADLFSQLVKVITREKDRGNMIRLIPDVKSLSGKIFTEWKKPKIAHKRKVEVLADLIMKSQGLLNG